MRVALALVASLAVTEAYFKPLAPRPAPKLFSLAKNSAAPALSHGGIGGNGGNNDDVWGGWNGGGWNGGGDDEQGNVHYGGGLGMLWDKYNEVLESSPLPTKAVTSLVGFTIGDLLAQNFLGEKGAPLDVKRLLRLASFGLAVHGPIGHYFYGALDEKFPKKDAVTVAIKVLIDQVLWAPIFTVIFFAWIELLQGSGLQKIKAKINQDLVRGVTASWKVWPLVHVINFRFIPSSQRLLYINTIQVSLFGFVFWSWCCCFSFFPGLSG
jgi:protein Mpv17